MTSSGFTGDPAVTSTSLTLIDQSNLYRYRVQIPGLGIDTPITLNTTPDGSSGHAFLGSINPLDVLLPSGQYIGAELTLQLNYVFLGDWQLKDPTTKYPVEIGEVAAGSLTPTASMPTTGTATYGHGENNVFGFAYSPTPNSGPNAIYLAPTMGSVASLPYTIVPVTGSLAMNVNFATGGISGLITKVYGNQWNNIAFNATLAGDAFAGTTFTTPQSGSSGSPRGPSLAATGVVTGAFYGPNANEVGAVWSLSDGTMKLVGTFGAAR